MYHFGVEHIFAYATTALDKGVAGF